MWFEPVQAMFMIAKFREIDSHGKTGGTEGGRTSSGLASAERLFFIVQPPAHKRGGGEKEVGVDLTELRDKTTKWYFRKISLDKSTGKIGGAEGVSLRRSPIFPESPRPQAWGRGKRGGG